MSKLIRINDKLISELDKVAGYTYNDKVAWLLGFNSDSLYEFKTNSKPIVNKLTNSKQIDKQDSKLSVNKLTDSIQEDSKQIVNSKLVVNKEDKLLCPEYQYKEIRNGIGYGYCDKINKALLTDCKGIISNCTNQLQP